MSQKVCGEQISGREKVKRPHLSTFPTTMFAFSRRSERGQGIQSKIQSNQSFLEEIYCQTFFPPSYASKSVWGEREKATVLHIPYQHVCFHHPNSSRIEWGTEWKPQIKQTFFEEFHYQNIFSSKLCLKKCVGRKGKGLGAPHFLPPCLLSAAGVSSYAI